LPDGGVTFNGVTRTWEDDTLLGGTTTGVCGGVLLGLPPCTKRLVKRLVSLVNHGETGRTSFLKINK